MFHPSTTSRRVLPATLSPLLAILLGIGLAAASVTGSPAAPVDRPALDRLPAHRLAAAEDDEVVLPGRVATAINRTVHSVDRAEAAIDDGHRRAALTALRATIENTRRAARAGLHQIDAVPVDEEAETTPGPDSVVAVLNLDQADIVRLSGLFDNLHRPRVVKRLNRAMTVTHNQRLRVLNTVIRLDPEGAGADYADGMADTVDGYTDEVATLTDALKYDRLTKPARTGLKHARTRSTNTQAKVTAAFGGGE